MSLQRYAEVSAHLRHFPADKKAEVIARMGIRRSAWEAGSARWSAAMNGELESGKTDLASQFGATVTRIKKRLDAQRPSLDSLGPLPGPDEADPAPASAPAPAPASAPAPPPSQPDGIAPPPPIAVPTALAPSPTGPAAPSPWARFGTMPSGLVVPAPASAPAPPAAVPAPPPSAPEDARASSPSLEPPPGEGEATSTVVLTGPVREAKLPFQETKESPTQAFKRSVEHALSVQGPAKPKDANELGSTVDMRSPLAHAAPAARPDVPARPTFGTPPAVATQPAAAASFPELTIEQYASLCVELHIGPERMAQTLARYGITPEARLALDAHWRIRFETDHALRTAFGKAYSVYRAWVEGQKPR